MTRRTRGLLLIIAASGVLVFLYLVRGVLTPFALAAVIAYLANPLVKAFESRQIPRSAAILLTYLVFGVVAIVAFNLVVPLLIRELNDVLLFLPDQLQTLEKYSATIIRWFRRIPGPAPVQDMTIAAISRLQTLVTSVAARTLDILFSIFSRALYLVLAPFLAYYLLRDFEAVGRSAFSLVPTSMRDEFNGLMHRLNRVGAGFIRGQLIVSGIVGLLVAGGLAALGVKYAALIGLIAGLFDVVPYFGPIIGAIPALLLGLLKSPTIALWSLIWIFVVNQVEGIFLQPRIMGEHVGLHPLTVVFAILAGGNLFGIWGMLMAVPVAATLKVVGSYVVEKLSTAEPER